MALGGGTFTAQNKILPGTYINFVSTSKTNDVFGERGVVAMPMKLSWGSLFTELTKDKFERDCFELFGVPYTDSSMLPLREVFRNAKLVYLYRINTDAVSAENSYASAKYPGKLGNNITIRIEANVDNESLLDVTTLFGTKVVDTQTVASSNGLKSNNYVSFKAFQTPSLETPIVAPLENGGDGNDPSSEQHDAFLEYIEPYYFNVLVCPANNSDMTLKGIQQLYLAFTKRLREQEGAKIQMVCPGGYSDQSLDYEGAIQVSVYLSPVETDENTDDDLIAVAWVAGAVAACELNKSLTNKKYDGECVLADGSEPQVVYEEMIRNGCFAFHKVGDDLRVLEDINTLTTFTDEKGEDFKYNQTIRIIDQIATDIATIFQTKYLGIVPNNASGRISLWSDIVSHHKTLEEIGAIENFKSENVTVEPGENKRSVFVTDVVSIVNAMEQLYMVVKVQ